MATHLAFQLRYIGVIPQEGCMEYGFHLEEKGKDLRLIVMKIESGLFRGSELMIQEAPDLCYQKLLADLQSEEAEGPVRARVSVTASDIARYRESHPTVKARKAGSRRMVTAPTSARAQAPAVPAEDAPKKEHGRGGR
jgi:hypothetical protein